MVSHNGMNIINPNIINAHPVIIAMIKIGKIMNNKKNSNIIFFYLLIFGLFRNDIYNSLISFRS